MTGGAFVNHLTRLLVPIAIYLGTALAVLGLMREGSSAEVLAEKLCCAATMAVLFIRDLRCKSPVDKDIGALRRAGLCALSLLSGAAAALALNCFFKIEGLTGQLQQDTQTLKTSVYSAKLLIEALILIVAAPAAEELLFRGLIYKRLRSWMGFAGACAVSSLIFACFHGNLLQGIYALATGIAIAWYYENSGTIFAAAAFHVGANLISLAATEIGGMSGVIGSHAVLFFFISSVFFAGTAYFFSQLTKKADLTNER